MKKFGIFACAALATLCTARLSAAVESDIVGYTTITMEADTWYMIGNPFVALDDDSEAPKLNSIFAGAGFASDDMLYILNNSTFQVRYWNDDNKGWSTHPRRYTEDNNPISDGAAVYIHKGATSGDIIFSGKVASLTVDFGSETGNVWEMVQPVFPEETTINKVVWGGNLTKDDRLYYLDSDSTFKVRYWNEDNKGWSTHPSRYRECSDTLKPGQAVYINKASAGKASMAISK